MADEPDATTPAPDGNAVPSDAGAPPARRRRRRRDTPAPAASSPPRSYPRVRVIADEGAGVVLAFLAWVWVAQPLLRGGPSAVRDVLRAKFVNKDAGGKWLP